VNPVGRVRRSSLAGRLRRPLVSGRALTALTAGGAVLALAIVLSALAWFGVASARGTEGHTPPAPAATHEPAAGHEPGAAAQHEAAAEHGGGGHEETTPELPDLIHLIYKAQGGHASAPAWAQTLYRFRDIVYALMVAGLIILVVRLGTRRMEMIPGRAQNVIEMFVEGFYNFIVGILGREEARRYVPFLGSLFVYIWWMNLFGLLPLMRSPTSALTTTAALGGSVFLYVQWTAVRRLGVFKYLHHLAGEPVDPVGWALVPLMFPLHIIGELAKPVSLSLRLFGNIFGEDILIGVFAGLGLGMLAFMKSPVGVPLHFPFILLAMLMSTIQALVFTLLSTVYIMQVLPHAHDEGHAEGHEEGAAAH
jgi:F-type H+-transporting ATPase subunit a